LSFAFTTLHQKYVMSDYYESRDAASSKITFCSLVSIIMLR